jgi:Glu-tRNA(Gln) amidotransferase subunit E-like FAD-binding protein
MKKVLAYGLSVGGTAVVLALVAHTLSRNLKYETARNALIHLLRTNPNQAELQCKTMPDTFFDAVGAAIKGGAMTGTQDPAIIAQAKGFEALDTGALEAIVDGVIAAHPAEWEQFRTGDDKARGKLTGFFMGKVMQASKGQADGKAATALLRTKAGL